MIHIRQARIEDIQQMLVIEQTFGKDAWNKQQFLSELTNEYATYIVALDQQTIVGYCGEVSMIDQADIQTIAVSPLYRSQGIGYQLLSSMIGHLKSENIKEIFLEVDVTNHIAIALYQKFKFQTIGKRKNYYANGNDALVMRKEIL